MAKQIMYLVRRAADNTMRTIVSTSIRQAMAVFFAKHRGAEVGEEFAIKVRGEGDWEYFKFQGGVNFRKISRLL